MLLLVAIATLLIVYVIYAYAKGEVRGFRLIQKDEAPQAFWMLILLYATVGLVMLALA